MTMKHLITYLLIALGCVLIATAQDGVPQSASSLEDGQKEASNVLAKFVEGANQVDLTEELQIAGRDTLRVNAYSWRDLNGDGVNEFIAAFSIGPMPRFNRVAVADGVSGAMDVIDSWRDDHDLDEEILVDNGQPVIVARDRNNASEVLNSLDDGAIGKVPDLAIHRLYAWNGKNLIDVSHEHVSYLKNRQEELRAFIMRIETGEVADGDKYELSTDVMTRVFHYDVVLGSQSDDIINEVERWAFSSRPGVQENALRVLKVLPRTEKTITAIRHLAKAGHSVVVGKAADVIQEVEKKGR